MKPKFSTVFAATLALALAVLMAAAVLLGRAGDSGGRTVVTVRLWDEQVAAAYRQSFDEFSREHPDIEVRVNVVAYKSYFDTLRTDVAGGGADDVFWLSNAYFAGYADNGRLLDIGQTLGPGASRAWDRSVVAQFTRGGVLWGVPQLTDAGIAVYFNADLLDEAGVGLAELLRLRWSPGGVSAGDTLRGLLTRLTVDAAGCPVREVGRLGRDHCRDGRAVGAKVPVAPRAAHPSQHLPHRFGVLCRRIARGGNAVGDTHPTRRAGRQHRYAPPEPRLIGDRSQVVGTRLEQCHLPR